MSDSDRPQPTPKKVAFASAIGATIEWYDFFIYGTAAGLVFKNVFFSNLSPEVGTLVSFATFAVGFMARPIGAVIFGHLGDRVGRKKMLVMTIIIMGVSTVLIGVLPTNDQIGLTAPVLLVLLRVFQGIGVGGEYGGAVLMAVEYAPPGRRGYFGSWPQIGVPAGLFLASSVFSLLSLLPDDQFQAWGWRIAFLLTVVLAGVGLYIRLAVLETPAFARIQAASGESKVPFMEMMKEHPKPLLQGMGTRWIEGVTFNAFAVLLVAYLVDQVNVSKTVVLNGIAIGAAVGCVFVPIFGNLSDKVGRKRVYGSGVFATILFIFPAFALMRTGSEPLIWFSIIIGLGIFYSAIYAPLAAFWAELFPTEIRYTGIGSVYQFSGIFASGLTPLIGGALITFSGGEPWLFAGYMVVVGGISLAVLSTMPETYQKEIYPAVDENLTKEEIAQFGAVSPSERGKD